MLITIVNMYRGCDAETFTHAVRGVLTPEQRDKWRQMHHCDEYDTEADEDQNNMFFRTIDLLEDWPNVADPGPLLNVDGENDPQQAFLEFAGPKLIKLESVKVDCTDFEAVNSPDNHGTTYYGGEIHISDEGGVDVVIKCHGNDRGDDECYNPTMEAVGEALGLVGTEFWDDELTDVFNGLISPGSCFQVGLGDKGGEHANRLVFIEGRLGFTTCPLPKQ